MYQFNSERLRIVEASNAERDIGEKTLKDREDVELTEGGVGSARRRARTRLCYRISVSHYVPQKMACKQFFLVKEKHEKQTNTCRGGDDNLSFATLPNWLHPTPVTCKHVLQHLISNKKTQQETSGRGKLDQAVRHTASP